MIDDEFSIDDEAQEEGEEEDLLAGVPASEDHHSAWEEKHGAGPATDDLDLDAFLSPVETVATSDVTATVVTRPRADEATPRPGPAPAPPATSVSAPLRADAAPAPIAKPPPPAPVVADHDDLDLDLDEGPSVSASQLKNIRILVVDPAQGWDGPVSGALQPFGFSLTVVETGVSAREELEHNPYHLVFLVVGQDAGWARMLLQRGRDRFEQVRFLVVIPQGAAAMTQTLIELGASDVLEVPVPQGTSMLVRIQAVLPDLMPDSVADPKELVAELGILRKRLLKAVADSESKANEMAQRAQDAESQLQRVTVEAQQRTKEITGVRSELTMLRDKSDVLEERVNRQKDEIAALKKRNSELEMAAAEKRPEPTPMVAEDASVNELRSLFAALTPFGFGFDQALDFLTDLAVQVGPSAPALQGHLTKLKLIRGVLKRIESKLNKS